MKRVFSVNDDSKFTDIGLLIARVGISALMLTHGIPKLMMLFSGAGDKFPGVFGMSPEFSLFMAILAEVLCSLFILAGFATRLSTIPLIITMLVAAFIMHASDPFSVKESSLHYLLVYVVLLFSGAGRYSVDNMLNPGHKSR